MLESLLTQKHQLKLFRLSNRVPISQILEEQGIRGDEFNEMQGLLQYRGITDSSEDLCDAPFRTTTRLNENSSFTTRFSDGTFPVFYSSLETETANAEKCHWFAKLIGKPNKPRTAFYLCFSCEFNGQAKDLRLKHTDWPKLTDDDYEFCNRLGTEAVKISLDGLFAPSARIADGTNFPVFTRESIKNPQELMWIAVTYDPSTDKVSLRRSMKIRKES